MRVLVTGGTGFLGRHIAWRLNACGHEVVFTGRDAAQAQSVTKAITHPHNEFRFLRIEHGSPQAASALSAAADGADAAIHCAALSSPWGKPDVFERANVESTRELVHACEIHRIGKLVHISTPSLYFDFRDRVGIREDDPLPNPVNDYARTKRAAEHIVDRASIDSVATLRPRAIIGPHDATLLPRILRVARTSRLPLMRGGKSLIDLTYVDNVVDAVIASLSLDRPRAVINISNGEPMTVQALFSALAQSFDLPLRVRSVPYPLIDTLARSFELIAKLSGNWEPPITRYSVGLLAFSQTLDISRARQLLGYEPKILLADGLRRTAEWFATHRGSHR